ncbi:MAG: hypothetical protein GX758_02070 [Tenericutes bacterium]|nr:hypothetical protein [Mycoplasmatota bacterium]
MSFITSLILVSSVVSWLLAPFMFIFLALDGIVYSLVAYSYNLFMLMSQLNFDVIYSWVGPLVDRVKAIIIVVIMFKLGISFIQYLVNPEKLEDKSIGGPKLVTNLFIVAGLLVSYTLIFSLLNEVTLLIIGPPEGYEFTVLKDFAGVEAVEEGDNGLLSRFIFGADSTVDIDNFGRYLSIMTLQLFLHDINETTYRASMVYSDIMNSSDSDFDMMKITGLSADITQSVAYKWPLLSTVMGLYLVYSIVKIAIEVGVRMFKLIILQILAPIAIISIIDGGMKSKVWSNFIDTLWKTFLDVFIRVGSMFFVTAFIGKFYSSMSELLNTENLNSDGITAMLILVLIIVAGYRLAQLLPAWIDSIFGSKLSENNKKGFGNFLGAVGGGLIGAGSGFLAGRASKAGFTGTFGNTLAGAFGGAAGGSKGKNVSDFFKNVNTTGKANRERAANIARVGGGGFAGGLTYGLSRGEEALGISTRQESRAGSFADSNKSLDNMMKLRGETLANQKNSDGIKYGSDKSSYASTMASKNSSVLAKKAAYDLARNTTVPEIDKSSFNKIDIVSGKQVFDEAKYNEAVNTQHEKAVAEIARTEREYMESKEAAEKAYEAEWESQLFLNKAVNEDAGVTEASKIYDKHARAKGTSSSSQMTEVAKAGGDVGGVVKTSRNANVAQSEKYSNKGASRRANRTNVYK